MKINNLKQYKQALMLKKDLEEIIPILSSSIGQLKRYKDRYSIVRSCITALDDLKTLLEIHKGNINKILENKTLIVNNENNE